MIILQGRQADLKRRRPCHLGAQTNIMPFSKRTYSFREGKVSSDGGHDTPLRKIKSRGRTFIGSRTPTVENTQEASSSSLTPFARSSIRLKSIRKRKMADAKSEENSFKREKIADKQKDEIEVRIEDNIRMRDGVMKLLGGCHDTRQAMDIGKNLLTINSRMLSLMSSLQKKRSSNILKDFNKGQSVNGKPFEPCLGDLAVSDIRIPLLWKQDAHFKTRAGEQPALLYHMFCLLKMNDQVFDTPLFQFSQIDTDVTFDEVFTFREIHHDFKLEMEVYYSVIQNPDNPAWTPIRTPKKSVFSSAPKFCLAAHAHLTVDDVKDGFVVSDFTMGGIGASATAVLGQVHDLPDNPLALWGQFSCQLRARPACFINQNLEGNILLQSSKVGQQVWEKYFCRLRQCTVQCWKHHPDKEESFSITPGLSIKLKKGTKIRVETNVEDSGRCVIILTSKKSEEKEPVLAFENEEDLEKWKRALQQAIGDIKAWKADNYNSMDIEAFEAKKLAFNKAMNYFDSYMANTENKPESPILSRKAGRNSSKATIHLPEVTPKIKSFYDQINIEEKSDNTDGKVPVELSKDKHVFEVLLKKDERVIDEEVVKEELIDQDEGSETSKGAGDGEEESLRGKDSCQVEDQETIGVDDKDVEDSSSMNRGSSVISDRLSENGTAQAKSNTTVVDSSDASEVVEDNDYVVCHDEGRGNRDEIATSDASVAEDNDDMDVTDLDRPVSVEECLAFAEADNVMSSKAAHVGGEEPKEKAFEESDSGKEAIDIDEAMETEESVLDYFLETIDSAAQLDESSDFVLTEEESGESLQIDRKENVAERCDKAKDFDSGDDAEQEGETKESANSGGAEQEDEAKDVDGGEGAQNCVIVKDIDSGDADLHGDLNVESVSVEGASVAALVDSVSRDDAGSVDKEMDANQENDEEDFEKIEEERKEERISNCAELHVDSDAADEGPGMEGVHERSETNIKVVESTGILTKENVCEETSVEQDVNTAVDLQSESIPITNEVKADVDESTCVDELTEKHLNCDTAHLEFRNDKACEDKSATNTETANVESEPLGDLLSDSGPCSESSSNDTPTDETVATDAVTYGEEFTDPQIKGKINTDV